MTRTGSRTGTGTAPAEAVGGEADGIDGISVARRTVARDGEKREERVRSEKGEAKDEYNEMESSVFATAIACRCRRGIAWRDRIMPSYTCTFALPLNFGDGAAAPPSESSHIVQEGEMNGVRWERRAAARCSHHGARACVTELPLLSSRSYSYDCSSAVAI